ncbi:MAG: HAD-IA family hydrolase [Nannocystaceae bacterium]
MQHQPPIVLLDVMDTLIRDPAFQVVPDFFGEDLSSHFALKDKQAFHAFERGELDEAAFHARYYLDGRPWDLEGLKQRLTAGYEWIEGMRALVETLVQEGWELHALSNYSCWYELVDGRCQVTSAGVQRSFVSCDTGVRKPSPAAYLGPCAALNTPPSGFLFVDDRAKNVRAARAVGMPAVRFRDAATLRAVLGRYRSIP